MRVRVLKSFKIRGELMPPGTLLNIPDEVLPNLAERVAVLTVSGTWLERGELRTRGHVPDLAGEIVRLTEGDLDLQRTLLLRHVEDYNRHHFWRLRDEWNERAAIMQHDGGMDRAHAETEAARCLNLLAFLNDLRGDREAHAA